MKARIIVLIIPNELEEATDLLPQGAEYASEGFEGSGADLHRLALQMASLAAAKFTRGKE